MMKIVFSMIIMFTFSNSVCINNSESTLDLLKKSTIKMIQDKKKKIKKEVIKNYKDALKKKKERMITLLKVMREIEYLMKANQIERKRTIKYWNDVVRTQAISN